MSRKDLLEQKFLVKLKIDVLIQSGAGRFRESSQWNAARSAMDPKYPSVPDAKAGIYTLVESGNGGREMAIRDNDGREFIVHQDHAEVLNVRA